MDELDPTPERLAELNQESENEYLSYLVDTAEKNASNRALLDMLRQATGAFRDILAHIGITWEPVTDFPTARDAILSRLDELEKALDIQKQKC